MIKITHHCSILETVIWIVRWIFEPILNCENVLVLISHWKNYDYLDRYKRDTLSFSQQLEDAKKLTEKNTQTVSIFIYYRHTSQKLTDRR